MKINQMKNEIYLFLFILSATTVNAQVTTTYFEEKDAFKKVPELRYKQTRTIPTKRMPTVDVEKLLKEDNVSKDIQAPAKYGYCFDVNYTMSDGVYEVLDSVRIWSLKISSPGAFSLNFLFDELHLAHDAQLRIFNTDGTMVYGPVTENQNLEYGRKLLTDLVAGDEVIIQILEPTAENEKSLLKISQVVHAYKNMFPFIPSGSSTKALILPLSCYRDVACYPAWSQETEGVVKIILPNGQTASGALLNNTAQNFRPFILTAYHVYNLHSSTVSNWTFIFGFKKYSCGGAGNFTTYAYSGATFRAGWASSDFALLELNTSINPSHPISFLGWDTKSTAPTSVYAMHHPDGIEMKLSEKTGSPSTEGNYWTFKRFTNGALEGGSSGGPLFDQNKRVIGQVQGGIEVCQDDQHFDQNPLFGKLNISWTGGGTSSTRLKDWLDPQNVITTSNTSINTVKALNTFSGPFLVPCTGNVTYSLALPLSAYDFSWSWSISTLMLHSGQGTNSVTVYKNPASTVQSAQISLTCRLYSGGTLVTFTKIVEIGVPRITSLSPSGTTYTRTGQTVYFVAYPSLNSSEGKYDWVAPGGSQSKWQNYNDITYYQEGYYPVSVRTYMSTAEGHACNITGTTYTTSYVSASDYSPSPSLGYPNPVSDVLNLDLDQIPAAKAQGANLTYDVRLYDGQGNLLRQASNKGGTIQYNVSNLPDGFYYLHIYDGVSSTPEIQQIMVQH